MTSEADDLATDVGTVELLWGRRKASTRGPKPTLTIEGIAGIAVGIADADGIEAVSMQRVAAELDFTKMSLYRYVSGKAELIAAMIDLAVGEPPDLSRFRGWRSGLERWAKLLWETWELHPWLPQVTVGDRVMGPNEVGWIEAAVGVLDGTGLSPAERMDTVVLLCGLIRNTQSSATTGTQPWSADTASGVRIRRLLDENREQFPALNSVASAKPSKDAGRSFGLRVVLDGLELAVARRVGSG